MTQLDLIDVGERLYPEGYNPSARKKPPCTADVIGSGPEGETCRTCLHYMRVRYHGAYYLKCGLMKAAWTHGAGTDIRAKWAACSKWETGNLLPPGFPKGSLDTPEGRQVAADWWDEHGNERAAQRLREAAR